MSFSRFNYCLIVFIGFHCTFLSFSFQCQDLSTVSVPLFLEMIQINMPEGVMLRIEPVSTGALKKHLETQNFL